MENTEKLIKEDIWTKSVVLDGNKLQLVPAEMGLVKSLAKNTLSKNQWHCVHWGVKTEADVINNLEQLILSREKQQCLPFLMKEKSSGEIIGISRYMTISRENKRLEIGGTWIGENWQKSYVNTEAKYLMLKYAFETLNCCRVEFKVDSLNFKSQAAVTRIGAKFEGELRNYIVQAEERKKDYKMYSILDSEWPNIKKQLTWYMGRYNA